MSNQKLNLDELKLEADKLGISYSANIGADKLVEKIKSGVKPETKQPVEKKLTKIEVAKMKAGSLRKVRITNLDHTNTGATTVYSSVENAYFSFARVIPLNMERAVEQCLIDQIKGRRALSYVPNVDKMGKPDGTSNHKSTPMFAIEYL